MTTKIDLNSLVAEIESFRHIELEDYEIKKAKWMHLIMELKAKIERLCRQGDDYKVSSIDPEYPIELFPDAIEYIKRAGNYYRMTIYLPVINMYGNLRLDGYDAQRNGEAFSIHHVSQYGDNEILDVYHQNDVRKYFKRDVIEVLLKEILKAAKTVSDSRRETLAEIRQSISNLSELGLVE